MLVQASAAPYATTYNEWYDITSVGPTNPSAGIYLCKSGKFTKTECSQTYSKSGNFIKMKINDFAVAVCHGDSGGPVFVSNKAYGIVKSIVVSGSETRATYFEGTVTRTCAGQTSYW